MRILHLITNTELGGAQRVCIELCNAAVADGHEVAVCSMQGGWLWQALDARVQQFYIKNLIKPIRPMPDLKASWEIRKVIKQYKPDILQLHSSKAGVLGRWCGRHTGAKIVYTVHGFDSIRVKHRVFLPLEKMLQSWCHAIVGVSQYDERNLRSEGITRNVRCIYNGIAAPADRSDTCLESLASKKIVMTVARISPPKKIQHFFDVAAQFTDDYVFVWIGGSDRYSLDEIHLQYKIPSNVVLLGDVPEASQLVHYADLFVLFSGYEGLPMSIIEALSKAKPVMASNVGGVPELVDRTNGALIIDAEDAVQAISSYFDLPADQKSLMCKSSLEKYLHSFSLDSMWGQYKLLYLSLLNKV